ncbi:MAG TPA: IS630 family transposase [Puia sp.]|nr:IS630 family transposase [Puia sp.]
MKKEPKYKERREAEREVFIKKISSIDLADIICVDESGVDDNIVPMYGWSEKGERSYAEQPSAKKKRLSIVAGYVYGTRTILAPFEYEGYTDIHLFNSWFEQQLIPALRPGQVVLLDNAAFHRSLELDEIAAQHGVEILYLPAYSPDLNPIEKFWANLKRNIRKFIKTAENFQEAITTAFKVTLSG